MGCADIVRESTLDLGRVTAGACKTMLLGSDKQKTKLGGSATIHRAMNNSTRGWRLLVVPAVFVVLLYGCHGTTAVNDLSPTTFSVSAQYGSVSGSWDRAQREAVAKAKEFCAARRETYAFINEQRTGMFGFTPQVSTITFRCGPDTTALVQQIERNEPKIPSVIQICEISRIEFCRIDLQRGWF